jgi:hypothetical protein
MERIRTISNTNTKKTRVTYNTKGIEMIINMSTKNIKVLNKTKMIMITNNMNTKKKKIFSSFLDVKSLQMFLLLKANCEKGTCFP